MRGTGVVGSIPALLFGWFRDMANEPHKSADTRSSCPFPEAAAFCLSSYT